MKPDPQPSSAKSISTHVLDLRLGEPARGIQVTLERRVKEGVWRRQGGGRTDADGRLGDLLSEELVAGLYRLSFDTGAYLAGTGETGFFPQVTITFVVHDTQRHYHVPLLLSPFGYSTYRGS